MLCRFWGAPSKCEFLKDGMNIVDVLAILPYFVSAIVLGLREAAEVLNRALLSIANAIVISCCKHVRKINR